MVENSSRRTAHQNLGAGQLGISVEAANGGDINALSPSFVFVAKSIDHGSHFKDVFRNALAVNGNIVTVSPFFCRVSNERDNLTSHDSPAFHAFVRGCADEALGLLTHLSANSQVKDRMVRQWKGAKGSSGTAFHFGEDDFGFAWTAVASWLNRQEPTQVCVWMHDEKTKKLVEASTYGPMVESGGRVINILRWNTKVVTHFDVVIAQKVE